MHSRLPNYRPSFRLFTLRPCRAKCGWRRPWTLLFALAVAYSATTVAQGQSFPAAPALGWDVPLRVAQQPDRLPNNEDSTAESPHEPTPAAKEAEARAEQQVAVLKLIASNQDAAQKRHEELKKEKADWEAKLGQLAVDGLDESRPFSFLSLDKARDELAAEAPTASALRDALAAAKDAVAQAAAEKADKERDLRRAKDSLEHNEDPATIVPLTGAVADAEHELKLADKQLELHRLESANFQLEQQIQALRQAYAQKKVDLYQHDVAFTQVMLDEVLSELDRRTSAAGNRLNSLENDLSKYLLPQMYQSRQRLDEARVAQDEPRLTTLQAEVQAKTLAQQAAQFESETLLDKQQRLNELKQSWKRRFDLASGVATSQEAGAWLRETQSALDHLRSATGLLNDKIESIRKQLASLEKKRQAADEADARVQPWLAESTRVLESQRRMCEKALAEIDAARLVQRKLLDDLTGSTLADTANRWLAEAADYIRYVWDYPLATVNDNDITVGRIVRGMILLVVGVYASRMLSRMFGRRLLSRMGINAGATAALQSVAFYLLVLIFTLLALKLVDVPLTAFTVLGGAVALGVGFGSQNIVNNFISGLILLAERPVKVGDLIQLAELYGNVEHIGPRSTRVRTGENLDIIVPNSTFLETNVVNWTLSDNHMRTKVAFGVAYGSPTVKVSHLALKAAANHDRVFDRPAPFVIFTDFGDNALAFELHFWVAVRTLMERRRIESDVRFNIDHLFREAGITIAFPQRDVHLITEQPIRVEVAPPKQSDSEAA
jgi:small-conductance mechanosensitive channel